MDFKRTTARLRRTFAYPSDSHPATTTTDAASDSDPDADQVLDEQEQEDLIRALARQNASRNAQFRLFLLLVPALSGVPYLLRLWAPTSSSSSSSSTSTSASVDAILSLLSLTSLLSTSWILWALPPGVTGVRALDAWVAGRGGGGGGGGGSADVPFWAPGQQRSPLEQYLPYLNAVLCVVLALSGRGWARPAGAGGAQWGHVSLANLPAFVYAVVLAAKMVMGGVDPERELAGLRYDYKGA